jgi:hypothetical protein
MDAHLATDFDVPALLEMIGDFFAWENIPFDAALVAPAVRALISNGALGHVARGRPKDGRLRDRDVRFRSRVQWA